MKNNILNKLKQIELEKGVEILSNFEMKIIDFCLIILIHSVINIFKIVYLHFTKFKGILIT